MQSNPILEPQQLSFTDYPAAHSMDTTWYAVDENGEIGEFDTNSDGFVPATFDASPEQLNAPESLEKDDNFYKSQITRDPWDQVPEDLRPGKVERNVEPDPEEALEAPLRSPRHYHLYGAFYNCNALYHWVASPARPMNIRDLPASVRDQIKIVTLKDFTFSSREPVDAFDYAPNCYGEWVTTLFPNYRSTCFPIPNRWACWTENDFTFAQQADDGGCTIFYAIDDDDHVALFRSNGFGAIPRAQWHQPPDYDEDSGLHLWKEMVASANSEAPAFPGAATPEKDRLEASSFECIKHWLEYPFFPHSPRFYGFYHYDLSWYHAGPYPRIGIPDRPVRLDEFSPEWRARMNPARFTGIRFADAERIQPFEHTPCMPGSLQEDDMEGLSGLSVCGDRESCMRRRQSEVWINTTLEQVHLCSEDSIRLEEDKWLLSRARRYYEKIAQLAR